MLLENLWIKRHFIVFKFFKIFKTIVFYPLNIIRFKRFGFGSYCSLKCSINSVGKIIIGRNTEINHNVTLWATNLRIGDNCQINPGTVIYGQVIIGNDVMIAPNCVIVGGNHNISNKEISMRFQGSNEKSIKIEDDVWIGANTTILDGVTIRKGSVIGAGSTVTKSTKEYSINFGTPAKFYQKR